MVGVPDDNPCSFAPSCPSSSLGGSTSALFCHLLINTAPLSPPMSLSLPLRSARNPLDTSGSRSHAFVNSSPPPSESSPSAPTGPTNKSETGLTGVQPDNYPSTLSKDLIDYNPEEYGGSSRAGKGNVGIAKIGSSSHGRLLEERLPHRAAHSDVERLLSHTHAHASLDARSSAVPCPRPSVTSFFRRTVHRVRRPSGESDTGLCTTKNGGGNNADVKRKRHQLVRSVVLDLKPEADLDLLQKQSIMNNLEERLEAAKKLHGEAADLKLFYESGTVAAMEDLRATGKAVPRCL